METLPTPIDIFLDPISLTIVSLYASLYVWESLFPRTKLPTIQYATLRGLVSFVIFFLLSSYLPLFTDGYLANYQLIDLSAFSMVLQVLIGLFFYQFVLYGYHRLLHGSNKLWRIFHQMHHSTEKLDIPSTYYFSPMDMIGFTLLGSVVFALIMGLSPAAITAVILALNFLSIFQHSNIKTPQWLGYFIQRPEQHAVHHSRGVHGFNYSDFPIYDLLFGTFKNPKDFQGQTGFYDGASAKIVDMLLFKDLNEVKKKSA